MRLFRRKPQVDTRKLLAESGRSLKEAKEQESIQTRKREQEHESVIRRLDRAATDNNLIEIIVRSLQH